MTADKTETTKDVTELADAMWQLLDDMGPESQSVCLLAKAKARIAFEPFVRDVCEIEGMMPIEEAQRIMKECEDAR